MFVSSIFHLMYSDLVVAVIVDRIQLKRQKIKLKKQQQKTTNSCVREFYCNQIKFTTQQSSGKVGNIENLYVYGLQQANVVTHIYYFIAFPTSPIRMVLGCLTHEWILKDSSSFVFFKFYFFQGSCQNFQCGGV